MLNLSQGERSEKQLAMPWGAAWHQTRRRVERKDSSGQEVSGKAVDSGSCVLTCLHQPTLSKQVNGIASSTIASVDDQMHLRLAPRGTARTLGTLQSPKSVCQRRGQPDQCCVLL
jgi:hypothetical protein